MAKDLNNYVLVLDGNRQLVLDALNEGKTVECAVEKGEQIKQGLEQGFHSKLQAHMELVEKTVPKGAKCGCGKPANIIVRFWR